MNAGSRLVPVVAVAACALGLLLVVRTLGDRPGEPEALDGAATRAAAVPDAQAPPALEPPPAEREPAEVGATVAAAATEPSPPSTAERPGPEAQQAIDALVKAHEHAAGLPGDGPSGWARASAELGLLQSCVGTLLAETNRGIEVADSRMEVADDEVKLFHAGELYVVRRGEFPVFDEARDRVSDLQLPRSPDFQREYEALYARALAALGAREGTR